MNRALSVAKNDFNYARRAWLLWGVIGIFTLIIVLATGGIGYFADDVSGETAVGLITAPAGIFVPITAIIASYLAIAGERESGQLNVLLSLPPSRLEVVVGKFLGRSAVVLLATVIAFLVGTVVSIPLYDGFPVGPFLTSMVLTALLGLAFVGLSIGISANATTRARAMAPAIGVGIVFATGIWGGLVDGINFVAEEAFDTSLDADTVDLIQILSPRGAYERLFSTIVQPELLVNLSEQQAKEVGIIPELGDAPFYLQNWFVFLLLLAWIVLPVAVGYLRFERADLS
jgi:ABC-2 type transport system permease protein